MSTLLLDTAAWDLCLDAAGNIAVATEPYSIEQDVASKCRLCLGEYYYDVTLGIPYLQSVFAGNYPVQLLKQNLESAALSIDGVITAVAYLTSDNNNGINGQIQIKTSYGTSTVIL